MATGSKEEMRTKMGDIAEISISRVFAMLFFCSCGIAAAFCVAHDMYATSLISDSGQTLRLLWVIQSPIVIFGYSLFRRNPQHYTYFKAVGRGLLALPAGALLNAFGAIVLGAPIRVEYFTKTINWSLLMSLLTFVPAASVFGSSWSDWQRLLSLSKLVGGLDYMISIPAHGAIIGAWVGAWPMPLDWERPWQEWPICVSYGAIMGYLLGALASLISALVFRKWKHVKGD